MKTSGFYQYLTFGTYISAFDYICEVCTLNASYTDEAIASLEHAVEGMERTARDMNNLLEHYRHRLDQIKSDR